MWCLPKIGCSLEILRHLVNLKFLGVFGESSTTVDYYKSEKPQKKLNLLMVVCKTNPRNNRSVYDYDRSLMGFIKSTDEKNTETESNSPVRHVMNMFGHRTGFPRPLLEDRAWNCVYDPYFKDNGEPNRKHLLIDLIIDFGSVPRWHSGGACRMRDSSDPSQSPNWVWYPCYKLQRIFMVPTTLIREKKGWACTVQLDGTALIPPEAVDYGFDESISIKNPYVLFALG